MRYLLLIPMMLLLFSGLRLGRMVKLVQPAGKKTCCTRKAAQHTPAASCHFTNKEASVRGHEGCCSAQAARCACLCCTWLAHWPVKAALPGGLYVSGPDLNLYRTILYTSPFLDGFTPPPNPGSHTA